MTPISLSRNLGAFVATCLALSTAHAGAGDHIRAGDALITPSLSTGLTYRTNVYRIENDVTGGLNLRVVPRLGIELDGPDVSFTLDGAYELRKYFASELLNFDRFNNFDVGAELDALEDGVVGFSLSEAAALQNLPVEAFSSEDPFSTQLSNDLEGLIKLRPGSALEFAVGGFWQFDDYQVPTGAQLDSTRAFNRKNTFGPKFEGRWDFFPRTALALDASYGLVRWQDNFVATPDDAGEIGSFLAIPDTELFKARAGLRGRIARPLVVVLMAGYGDARYDEDSVLADPDATGSDADASTVGYADDLSGLDHLLLDAQLRYEFGIGQRATAGYSRDFQDAFFTNYVSFDYVYGNLNNRFGDRVGTDLEFGARFEDYGGEVVRSDIRLVAKGDVSVYATEWATFTGGVWWNQRASTDDDVEYDDVNLHLAAVFTY